MGFGTFDPAGRLYTLGSGDASLHVRMAITPRLTNPCHMTACKHVTDPTLYRSFSALVHDGLWRPSLQSACEGEGNFLLVDGGYANNFPVEELHELGAGTLYPFHTHSKVEKPQNHKWHTVQCSRHAMFWARVTGGTLSGPEKMRNWYQFVLISSESFAVYSEAVLEP
eukprot:263744-Amphidinium_carterae.2